MSTVTRRFVCSLFALSLVAVISMYPPAAVDPSESQVPVSRSLRDVQTLSSSDIPPRLLLGIFSTDSENDTRRRKLIRKTYLSTYGILQNAGMEEGNINKMCSLQELLQGTESGRNFDHCSIVYTFVVGAHDSSDSTAVFDLTELPEESQGTSFTVDKSAGIESSSEESDVTYLNIRENMNEGKTATWFHYASTILPESLNIDLIAKVDSDTVVFPRSLVEQLETNLQSVHHVQRPATNIYGGTNEVSRDSEVPYMQGGFYFLSRDVARMITGSDCARSEIVQKVVTDRGFTRSEDREMGNYVNTCWPLLHSAESNLRANKSTSKNQELQRVVLNSHITATHQRTLKEALNFRVKWKEGLAVDIAQLRLRTLVSKYPESATTREGCPPTTEAYNSELEWFDSRENMKQAKNRFVRFLADKCGANA